MKKLCAALMTSLLVLIAGCSKKQPVAADARTESQTDVQADAVKPASGKFLASTSWTAVFMDIAGIDDVQTVAPANLRHPPEYEVTVSDIQKINGSTYFVYAGFERMMKILSDSVKADSKMIKIKCDNSIQTVSEEARKLAEIFGTQGECERRIAEYRAVIEDGKKNMEGKGLFSAKVLCNKNQIYLAKELGFDVVMVFGPGEVTSEQIAFAKSQDFVFIIDNVHNPVAGPLLEVAPKAKYLVWRNFPESVSRGALKKMVANNIDMLFE